LLKPLGFFQPLKLKCDFLVSQAFAFECHLYRRYGEDLNEWLAVNTVDFYNAISMLYATLGRERRNISL
jgi:hypothetical protein